MIEGEWEEENGDYEGEIGNDGELRDSFDLLSTDLEAFSDWLENSNNPSERRMSSNYAHSVNPMGKLPSPSPTIVHNYSSQALTPNPLSC